MNYIEIENRLKDYNREPSGKIAVENYISYLKKVETDKDRKTGEIKNKWFFYVKEKQLIELFKKVANDGLYIDGETITIQSMGGSLTINYNYQAYKNKLLCVYPETTFDIQNVYEGDSFKFQKKSGVVEYTHEMGDPFKTDKKIIGCYCVIKNSRGEFLEILNMDEIAKMRAVAKTQTIWNEWESEMILKSVMKRACKRHFRDIVMNIEKHDNENYDLDKKNEPELPELTETHPKFQAVKIALQKGNYTMEQMEEKYKISEEVKLKLTQDETIQN